MSIPRCLTIAGSDSGGGAGIQADLKTFQAFGCFGTSAVTAITVQNTQRVAGVHPVPADFVSRQIAAVAEDIGVDAAKTGMLGSADVVRAVAVAARRFALRPLVVDPVILSSSGDRLLSENGVAVLRDELLPHATVATPNLPEAEALSGVTIDGAASLERAARTIRALGTRWVLVTGGHRGGPAAEDEANDWLFGPDGLVTIEGRRVATTATHGTGCTLSAAICAGLARGEDVEEAVRAAKAFVQRALEHAAPIGRGRGPVNTPV